MSNENLQAKLFDHAHRLLKTHETLLRDAERNRKFYDALHKRITPDCSVVDIGAGTGVWSIVAAKLGARRVVAIEMDELMAAVIEMLGDEHGVRDRVEVVCARSFDAPLEREFDLVVSETIGYLGYDEMIVDVMADARKRFLREGGHIIPETVSLNAAAGKLHVRKETVPAGIDLELATLSELNLHSPRVLKRPREVTLLTTPVCLISTDLRRAEQRPPLRDLKASWEGLSESPDCVVVWVESRLAPRVNLKTNRRTTSWYPNVYRIAPRSRGKLDRFEFSLSLTAESNYWTATFIQGGDRSSQSYSPEFAATRMVGAARGGEARSNDGRMLIAGDRKPPLIVELRDATPEDVEFFKTLYRTTRAEEVAAFGWNEPEQNAFLDMQFNMQTQSYGIQHPDAECSVILCDRERAGRIIVDRSAGESILVDISVRPDFQKRGIASQMLRQLQAGSDAVVLTVDKINLAARRLYEKLGFVTTSESELMFTMRWEK